MGHIHRLSYPQPHLPVQRAEFFQTELCYIGSHRGEESNAISCENIYPRVGFTPLYLYLTDFESLNGIFYNRRIGKAMEEVWMFCHASNLLQQLTGHLAVDPLLNVLNEFEAEEHDKLDWPILTFLNQLQEFEKVAWSFVD